MKEICNIYNIIIQSKKSYLDLFNLENVRFSANLLSSWYSEKDLQVFRECKLNHKLPDEPESSFSL